MKRFLLLGLLALVLTVIGGPLCPAVAEVAGAPVVVTTETTFVRTVTESASEAKADTAVAAIVAPENNEPWWFKYFWEALSVVLVVGIPILVKIRSTMSARGQAAVDAAVLAFNHVEYLSAVTPAKYKDGFEKLSDAMDKAAKQYWEATGRQADSSTLAKIKGVIEGLVYQNNITIPANPTSAVSSKQ